MHFILTAPSKTDGSKQKLFAPTNDQMNEIANNDQENIDTKNIPMLQGTYISKII